MKNNKFNRLLATMLTIVMTFMLITPVLASTKGDTETNKKTVSKKDLPLNRAAVIASIKAQDGETQFSQDDLEQMRSALLELLDSTQELSMTLSSEGKKRALENGLQKSEDQYDEARKQIEQMSFEQLTTLRKVLNPSGMHAKLANSRATLNEYNKSVMKSAAFSQNSPDAFPGVEETTCGAPVSTGVIIAADVIYFVAEGVREAAQNACDQVVVAAGFGGNGSLACIVVDVVYILAKAVNQGIHFCDDDYAGAVSEASFERLGHIHDDIEDIKANDNTNYANIIGNATTNTTTITSAVTTAKTDIINNDNTNKTTIVNNDNANKTTIVNNDNANTLALTTLVNSALTQIIANATDNKNLLLRTQIEADLASTDGSTFVALYETPVTRCFPSLNALGLPQAGIPPANTNTTQCGLLDLVRSIVQQTIANVNTGTTAQSFFNTGDAQRAAGQYKAAYASYRRAYKAASQ